MIKTIAIDMDETLVDAVEKLKDWYYRDYNGRFSDESLYGKDMVELMTEERQAVFRQYLNTPGFFRDLSAFPDAAKVMEELNKKYKIFLVSAAMEFPNSLQDKFNWAQEHLPFISWQQICLCGDKSLVQTDMMIDDRSRNFEQFRGKAYLYTAHHNLHENHYERVNNWKEIADKLL